MSLIFFVSGILTQVIQIVALGGKLSVEYQEVIEMISHAILRRVKHVAQDYEVQ